MLLTNDNDIGGVSADDIEKMVSFPADAWLIGPGMGREDQTMEFVRNLIPQLKVPTVVDADALFAVCGYLRVLKQAEVPIVITPHPGEMGRLIKRSTADVQSDRRAAIDRAARETGAAVVLKGAGTLVAAVGQPLQINRTGNPGMS